ncbi:hypothetical protein [Paenibacillus sp. 2TAB19]
MQNEGFSREPRLFAFGAKRQYPLRAVSLESERKQHKDGTRAISFFSDQ